MECDRETEDSSVPLPFPRPSDVQRSSACLLHAAVPPFQEIFWNLDITRQACMEPLALLHPSPAAPPPSPPLPSLPLLVATLAQSGCRGHFPASDATTVSSPDFPALWKAGAKPFSQKELAMPSPSVPFHLVLRFAIAAASTEVACHLIVIFLPLPLRPSTRPFHPILILSKRRAPTAPLCLFP